MRTAKHSVLTWLLALGGSALAATAVVTLLFVSVQPTAATRAHDSIVAEATGSTSGGPLPRVVVGSPAETTERSPLTMSLKDGEPGHLDMPLKGQGTAATDRANALRMCLKHDLRSGDPVCERDLPRIHMALR